MDEKLGIIIEDIRAVKLLLFKKLLNRETLGNLLPSDAVFVLVLLEKQETATMSEIGKELFMPKPNATTLIDKLVENNLVERIADSSDRRIVRIKMTDFGHSELNKFRTQIKENIKNKLMLLSNQDIDKLADSLNSVKEIIQKLVV